MSWIFLEFLCQWDHNKVAVSRVTDRIKPKGSFWNLYRPSRHTGTIYQEPHVNHSWLTRSLSVSSVMGWMHPVLIWRVTKMWWGECSSSIIWLIVTFPTVCSAGGDRRCDSFLHSQDWSNGLPESHWTILLLRRISSIRRFRAKILIKRKKHVRDAGDYHGDSYGVRYWRTSNKRREFFHPLPLVTQCSHCRERSCIEVKRNPTSMSVRYWRQGTALVLEVHLDWFQFWMQWSFG